MFSSVLSFGITKESLLIISYSLATIVPLGIDYFLREKISSDESALNFASLIISTLVLLLVSTQNGNHMVILSVEIVLAVVYFLISSYRKQRLFDYVGGLLVYLSSYQFAEKFSTQNIDYVWILFFMALIFNISGMIKSDDSERSKHWRFIGLAGMIVASMLSYIDKGNCVNFLITLIVFGSSVLYESYKENNSTAKYISFAILVTALEFGMDLLNIREQHLYTAVWSLYFGFLAYINHYYGRKNNRDVFAVIALFFLTVPLFFQAAYGFDNRHIYGLILGLESIIILLFGMNYKYRLMIWWGGISLSIIVLDQTKEALLALPKWIIIGGVGLLFLGGAIYLLSKNNLNKN